MNLCAVRGQYILGTNWWTSVNISAADIYLLTPCSRVLLEKL